MAIAIHGIDSRAARWCGRLFLGIGAVHLAYGVAAYWPDAVDLVQAGLGGASGDLARERFFWYMLGGPAMITAGLWARAEYLRTGRVPRQLAWYAGFLGAQAALMPDSGFWLFLPVAYLAYRGSAPAA